MANTAPAVVDRVLPDVPVRQYVLSLPWELRLLAAVKAPVLTALGKLLIDAIFGSYRARARRAGLERGQCGAIDFVQRFGSSLNLNIHFHVVVMDGVWTRAPGAGVRFHATPAPTFEGLSAIVERVRERALAWLRRNGHIDERAEHEHSHELAGQTALEACAAIAMSRGRTRILGADREELHDHGSGRPAKVARGPHGVSPQVRARPTRETPRHGPDGRGTPSSWSFVPTPTPMLVRRTVARNALRKCPEWESCSLMWVARSALLDLKGRLCSLRTYGVGPPSGPNRPIVANGSSPLNGSEVASVAHCTGLPIGQTRRSARSHRRSPEPKIPGNWCCHRLPRRSYDPRAHPSRIFDFHDVGSGAETERQRLDAHVSFLLATTNSAAPS